LGYPDGFQIWDISNMDNVHELISIRDDENIGEVKVAKVCNNKISHNYNDDNNFD
jgi:hypothetical protein